MPRPGNSRVRGYGPEHRRLRAQLLPYAYGQKCWRCGEVMLPTQALDLGHSEDRSSYTGIEHASCNRRAGARKARHNDRRKAQPSGDGTDGPVLIRVEDL